jgi:hypothetical protein
VSQRALSARVAVLQEPHPEREQRAVPARRRRQGPTLAQFPALS